MPFLFFSRSNSIDGSDHQSPINGNINNVHQNYITKTGNGLTKSAVTFIPSQIDALAATTPRHHRLAQTPLKLLVGDTVTLLHCLILCASSIFSWNSGFFSARNLKSFLRDPLDVRDLVCQGILGVWESWALVLGIPAILLLPGLVWVMGVACLGTVVLGIGWVLNGGSGNGRVVRCCGRENARRGVSKEGERARAKECVENEVEFGDERWMFVNGVMTSKQALQSHLTRLSRTFHRPILGIHQPTNGLLFDLLSSLFLRTFAGFPTPTTNALYDQLRCACLDSSIDKIILLAHGTGGIIISIVLDRLFADLPGGRECLGKIEVYTFGNASGWMGNPNRVLGNVRGGHQNTNGISYSTRRSEGSEKTISHIEHYANDTDVLARWGILHNIREVLDNRYAGRVFVMNGPRSGLIGEGYLDQMWPICHGARCNGSGRACGNDCHIHSSRYEDLKGCGSNCDDHAGRHECENRSCRSHGKVCERLNCNAAGHRMVCTKEYRGEVDCENYRECETHGAECVGCEIHGSRYDGRHNLVCVKGCKLGRDCKHLKECQTHGVKCTGPYLQHHHHHSLLDQVVEVDIDTATQREFTAKVNSIPRKLMTLNLNRSINQSNHLPNASHSFLTHNHNHSHTQILNTNNTSKHLKTQKTLTPRPEPSKSTSTSPDISPKNTSTIRPSDKEREIKRASWLDGSDIDCVGQARAYASECEGMTVRELSRLWRYVGGERPVGEGVEVEVVDGGGNGLGEGLEGVVNRIGGNGVRGD